ncbi:MAG: hypothetical protein ACXWSC_05720, partial [Bdellovibrionota bacterium]
LFGSLPLKQKTCQVIYFLLDYPEQIVSKRGFQRQFSTEFDHRWRPYFIAAFLLSGDENVASESDRDEGRD